MALHVKLANVPGRHDAVQALHDVNGAMLLPAVSWYEPAGQVGQVGEVVVVHEPLR